MPHMNNIPAKPTSQAALKLNFDKKVTFGD